MLRLSCCKWFLTCDGVGAQITDAMLHPETASALVHNLKVPWATFRKTFPLYMSISLVPYVVRLTREQCAPSCCCCLCLSLSINQSITFLVLGTHQGGQQTTSLTTSVVFWDQQGVGTWKKIKAGPTEGWN